MKEKPEFVHFFLYGLLRLKLRECRTAAARTMCREIFARRHPEWNELAKVYGTP